MGIIQTLYTTSEFTSMSSCYRCKEKLTSNNSSVEHIIINACGGKLKSTELLCSECNRIFGEKFDSELAQTTNDLANLLLIKRERGNPQKIKGVSSESKKECYFEYGGDISMTKPDIDLIRLDSENISERKINVKVPNTKILQQTLSGLKRKYPNLDIKNALEKAKNNQERFNEAIEFKSSIGGHGVFKSILKTAINYHILKGGQRNEIEHLFPYLEGHVSMNVVWMHYPDSLIYTPIENEVTHIIKLVGNPTERCLYCYVELFNVHCFIVQLNKEYSGQEIDEDYIFNVHTHEVRSGKTNLKLSRDQLLKLFSERDSKPFANVQKRYERILRISQLIQHKHHMNRAISEAVENSFRGLKPGTAVNEEILLKMRNEVFRALQPFLKY